MRMLRGKAVNQQGLFMSSETLLMIMSAVVLFCLVIERRVALMAHISGACLIIMISLFLANIGVVPSTHPLYDLFSGPAVPIALALILFSLDFRELRSLPRSLLFIWGIGVIASSIGGIIAALIANKGLGPDAPKLAAQLTASYIGGGENAVAMQKILDIPSELFLGCFGVDNIVTSIWMVTTMVLARSAPQEITISANNAEDSSGQKVTLVKILASITAACLVNEASKMASKYIGFLHPILYLGIIGLAVGQVKQIRKFLAPSYLIGTLLFTQFFFSIGAISDLRVLSRLHWAVIAMPFIVVSIHGVLIYGSAHFFRIASLETSLASQSLIGGPATAMALAQAKGWRSGISLGLIVGVLGYAVANYFGIAVFHISSWLINCL